jgi:hypothetical protein
MARLFDVPVLTQALIVQRNPNGFSRDQIERASARTEAIAVMRDAELRGSPSRSRS